MDVGTRIAQWRDQPPEQWIKAANRYLPTAVTGILVVAIAYQLAMLTWRALPGATTQGPIPTVVAQDSSPSVTQRSFDSSSLKESHLFGIAPVVAVAATTQTVVDAPDTSLSLKLTGIIYGEGGVPSQAIVANDRQLEKTYKLGDLIEGANGTALHAVYGDRVILSRDGRLETLRQPQQVASGGSAPRIPQRPVANAPAQEDGSLRQAISENATRLTDIMRIAPHVEGGQVVGFRLNPGRDRETFEKLGLQPGDVVTDINGTLLDDPSRGLQVFEALGEATMANVTILRNGVPQLIVIDTSQLQSLQENRE
jgi:general secretion pathway protein C